MSITNKLAKCMVSEVLACDAKADELRKLYFLAHGKKLDISIPENMSYADMDNCIGYFAEKLDDGLLEDIYEVVNNYLNDILSNYPEYSKN